MQFQAHECENVLYSIDQSKLTIQQQQVVGCATDNTMRFALLKSFNLSAFICFIFTLFNFSVQWSFRYFSYSHKKQLQLFLTRLSGSHIGFTVGGIFVITKEAILSVSIQHIKTNRL